MLKNYLKVVWRNIKRHKGYSFINVAGLALGLACCLLICIWVLDELSFDKFHQNAPNLYRVEEDQDYSGRIYHVTVTPYPLAPTLVEEIPEIIDATRYVWAPPMTVSAAIPSPPWSSSRTALQWTRSTPRSGDSSKKKSRKPPLN